MPKRPAASEATGGPTGPCIDPTDIASKGQCTVHRMHKLTHDDEGNIYLKRESFPSYVEDDIWAILQGCGFEYSNNGFRSDELGISMVDHEDDIRKQLAVMGLPRDLEDDPDDEDDPTKVKNWVAFAHVPIRESDAAAVLRQVPLPSDYEALLWLGKLGFQVNGETKYIYRGDSEIYHSVRDIRAFVRRADNASLLSPGPVDMLSPRKRARRATRKQDMPISERELLRLRLWAAVSPTPLKVFGESYNVADLEDEAAPPLEIDISQQPNDDEANAAEDMETDDVKPPASVPKESEEPVEEEMEEEKKEEAKPAAEAKPKKRGRGRPRKKPIMETDDLKPPASVPKGSEEPVEEEKKEEAKPEEDAKPAAEAKPKKRGPGRPRKNPKQPPKKAKAKKSPAKAMAKPAGKGKKEAKAGQQMEESNEDTTTANVEVMEDTQTFDDMDEVATDVAANLVPDVPSTAMAVAQNTSEAPNSEIATYGGNGEGRTSMPPVPPTDSSSSCLIL